MAAVLFPDDDEPVASINVVPFVDIVLVLLVIFMLTSSAIVRASISVDLPIAASAGAHVASSLNIVLTADEELFLNGERADLDEVGAYVARAAWKDAGLQAVISADERVAYGRVIRIIDVVKRNGVKTFALNIEREL